jgi:hypothetical protein
MNLLKHIRGQTKLNKHLAKWVEFVETFPYIIKYNKGKVNIITDALSRHYIMLSQLDHKIFGLESIKELYATNFEFKDAYENYREGRTWNKYVLHDGLLYRANKVCVPTSSIRLLFLQEVHGGGLMGHFGVKKTKDVLAAHFFWPKMRCNMECYVSRCTTCNKVKSLLNPHGLYMPLPISIVSLEDNSMDFILGLHRTKRGRDNILWLTIISLKWLILYHVTGAIMHLMLLISFFAEIVCLHGVPNTIVLDRETKFLSQFWRTLWFKLGTKLLFSTTCHPQTNGQTEIVNRTLSTILWAV